MQRIDRRTLSRWVIKLSSLAVSLLMAPVLFAQHDVHATLIDVADRKPAPVFHLMSDVGKNRQPSNYRGKVVLLNFWATECGGCVLEIPSFIELESRYKYKGFTAVGVSVDIPYEGLKNADEAWTKVRPFIAKYNINYPILMGDTSASNAYSIKAYPATYLIDKSGRIAAVYVGVVSKDDVASNIQSLLSER